MKYFIAVFLFSVVLAQDAYEVGDGGDFSSMLRITGGMKVKYTTAPSFVALKIYFGEIN